MFRVVIGGAPPLSGHVPLCDFASPGVTGALCSSLAEILVLAETAGAGRIAPPTSTSISSGMQCVQEHVSPLRIMQLLAVCQILGKYRMALPHYNSVVRRKLPAPPWPLTFCVGGRWCQIRNLKPTCWRASRRRSTTCEPSVRLKHPTTRKDSRHRYVHAPFTGETYTCPSVTCVQDPTAGWHTGAGRMTLPTSTLISARMEFVQGHVSPVNIAARAHDSVASLRDIVYPRSEYNCRQKRIDHSAITHTMVSECGCASLSGGPQLLIYSFYEMNMGACTRGRRQAPLRLIPPNNNSVDSIMPFSVEASIF